MEDINKNDSNEYNKPEELTSTEEVSNFKEAVVNPDKQEMDNKFQGMRDLFTSIITENRKDYEKQVSEMKNLFASVLEDNRKQLQIQLQDMYKTLPRMFNEVEKSRKQEEYVVLNDEDAMNFGGRGGKYTRLNVVKELIGGKDNREIRQKLGELYDEIGHLTEKDKQLLSNVVEEVYGRISKMEKRVQEEMEKGFLQLRSDIQITAKEQAHKQDTYGLIRSLADNIRAGK
jgi:hypothetical protein